MGLFCNKKRVQDSLYKEALSFPNSCFSQPDRKSSTRGRGQRTPTHRGSGENKPGRSRILLSNFPGSQEKREITIYNRSVQTEFLPGHSVFQNGNGKQSQTIDSVSIFGRLVGQKSNSGRYPQRLAVHHQADFISRTDNQRKEVRFNSCPEFCFYRDGISDSQEHSLSAMGQSTRHSESCTQVQETRTSISKTIPVSSGEVRCSCSICCLGRLHLRPLQMALFAQRKPHGLPLEHSILINMQIMGHLEWWNSIERFVQGDLLKPPLPSHTLFIDASLSRWGAHLEQERLLFHGVWSLDQSALHINVLEMKAILLALKQCHQHVNNTTVMIATDNSSVEAYLRKQGGYPLSISLLGGLGNSLVVRQEKHKPSCSPRARQIQYTGRTAESSVQANFDRVVFGLGCLQPNSISYRLPKRRPVCNSSQQQTTSLRFPYSRRQSSSNRRSINELGPDRCLRIFSVRSDSGNNQQDSSISVQNCSSSPIMARSILVPRVTSATSSTSHQASCKTASVNSTAVCEKQYQKPQTPRFDIVRKSLRDRSFLEKVAEHASKARRISTRKVYDLKWIIFSRWCRVREIDPVMASPGIVADFLLHMFQERKCQVSTVKG